MKSISELKAAQAEQLAKFEQEHKVAASLPLPAQSIYVHTDHCSVKYSKERFPARFTFPEAFAVYQAFKPFIIEAEHWKSGCLSVKPAKINDYSRDERATMDGASWACMELQAGKGFVSHALTFYAEIDGVILDIEIELEPESKWLPLVDVKYDTAGHVSSFRCSPLGLGEDQMRKWWSEAPAYHLAYYWADSYNFEAWASNVKGVNL